MLTSVLPMPNSFPLPVVMVIRRASSALRSFKQAPDGNTSVIVRAVAGAIMMQM
jgi:hypothetical protein